MAYDPYPIIGSPAPEAIDLGRIIVNGRKEGRLRYGGGNHVLVFGKSGSGKDTRIVIPSLLSMHGKRSVVCVDPKGEMAATTFKHRNALHRANGGRAVVLNPFGVISSEYQGYEFMAGGGYNPMVALDPYSPDFNLEAGLMAEAIIPMSPQEKNPFFPLTARALTTGLTMYEVCKATEQGRVPSLSNVRAMICEAAQEAMPPSKFMPDGILATGIPRYAMEMANSIILGMRNKGGMFTNWTRDIQGVAATARSETEFLDDIPMALNLARNDFDFREVKERPTTVYLVLPIKLVKRQGKWLRILLTAALNACMRPRAEDEPSTLFIMNEFYSQGHLQLIEDNFTVVRGAGIQMMPILQGLGQLQTLYGDNFEIFLANADAITTFAPNDLSTAKWFSERCGDVARLKTTVNESWTNTGGSNENRGTSPTGETSGLGTTGGWSYAKTANHSLERERFLSPSDLFRMQPGEMRIIVAGLADSVHAHAKPYWQMKNTVAPLAFENPYNPNARLTRLPQTERTRHPQAFFKEEPKEDILAALFANFLSGKAAAPEANAKSGTDNGSETPSPAPKPKRGYNPDFKAAMRHPSYPRDPEKPSGVGSYASGHPGYTPDPPKKSPGSSSANPFGEDDDTSQYNNDT